jgi:hypothetical protein
MGLKRPLRILKSLFHRLREVDSTLGTVEGPAMPNLNATNLYAVGKNSTDAAAIPSSADLDVSNIFPQGSMENNDMDWMASWLGSEFNNEMLMDETAFGLFLS